MDATASQDLLDRLLKVKTGSAMTDFLRSIGDDSDVSIEQPFGRHQLKWVPYGQTTSNISTIGYATKPGKSLAERITNAIDALIEDRAAQASRPYPSSPRDAAQAWFGRRKSGPDSGLFQGISVETDKKISVVILESDVPDCPTVDVIDSGIGITPDDLHKTILSLQAGNKIQKFHLIGAFGQGGSSTLGFSEFVTICSRARTNPAAIGFTVIRIVKLDTTYKEDCYAYLVNADGTPLVAQLASPDEKVVLYDDVSDSNVPALEKGTLVRHVAYRMSGISKSLGPAQGNLYHYLHYTLFDPLLPFRIWDLRSGKTRSEYVGGSRNRLMKPALSQGSDETDGRIQVKLYRPMEYIVPAGSDVPCIGIEYWVVWAFKKSREKGEEHVLRASSAELFVQPNHPIVVTLNGQTQGEMTGTMFREIGLGLLSRHTIVHIDASAADSRVRRELFASSREGVKDGPVLDSITSSLHRMLEEDEDLHALEKELTERLSKKDSASTREEVRQQVTRLLREAGIQVTDTARADVEGRGKRQIVQRVHQRKYRKRDPLPTLPYPEATFLRFASPDQHLAVHLQDSELVLVETDADAEFDRRGTIGIRSTNDFLEIASKANLSGGRIRWRLRPSEKASAGSVGELTAFLTRPNGTQLTATISFEVLPVRERPSRQGKTPVPPFEIRPIDPSADEEEWGTLWPNDQDNRQEQERHAYKADFRSGKTWVFYSTAYPPYAGVLEKLKIEKPDLVEHFKNGYEIWIAYHAILQRQAEEASPIDVDEEKLDELLDLERSVVASMQVKQALQFAELWKKSFLDQSANTPV